MGTSSQGTISRDIQCHGSKSLLWFLVLFLICSQVPSGFQAPWNFLREQKKTGKEDGLCLTSVSKKRLKALFFLMLFLLTDMATLRPTMITTNNPPITPAAMRGVLRETHGRKQILGICNNNKVLGNWSHNKQTSAS